MSEQKTADEKLASSSREMNMPIRSAVSGNSAPLGLTLSRPGMFYGGGQPTALPRFNTKQKVIVPLVSYGDGGSVTKQEVQPSREFEILKTKVLPGRPLEAAGRIKAFRRVIERWGFTRRHASEILGFDNEAIVGELYLGIERVQQRDVRERLKLFLSIAVDLDGLYDDDDVIKWWLDQPQKLLRGKTPRMLFTEGSVEGLLRVRQLVLLEANR